LSLVSINIVVRFKMRLLDRVQRSLYKFDIIKPPSWDQFLKNKKRSLYAGSLTKEHKKQGYYGITPFERKKQHLYHNIINKMPIPDDSIDVFQSEDVFEHIEFNKLETIFKEIYRVLKPGAIFRLSLPDYSFDHYAARSHRDKNGEIIYDPLGGGEYIDGKVCNGGHVWFPKKETVEILFKNSPFEDDKVKYLHYYDANNKSITNKIDYSLGMVYRTPDHDERAKTPYRAMSIVVDAYK